MKCNNCAGTGVEPNHREIGEMFRKQRKQNRVSLIKMSDELHFSAQYLCDLEHGRRRWTKELMNDYANVLIREGKA